MLIFPIVVLCSSIYNDTRVNGQVKNFIYSTRFSFFTFHVLAGIIITERGYSEHLL